MTTLRVLRIWLMGPRLSDYCIAVSLLSRQGKGPHEFDIRRYLWEQAGYSANYESIYVALGKLQKMGVVDGEWGDETPDGRTRRYRFRLTEMGTVIARRLLAID